MSSPSALATATSRALLRQGGTGLILTATALLALLGWLAGGIGMGAPGRLAVNVLMAGQALLLPTAALLYSYELLDRLAGSGSAPVLLVPTGARDAYLGGLFLGLASALAVLAAPLLLLDGLAAWGLTRPLGPLAMQTGLWALAALLTGAVALFLGQWLRPIPALLTTALLWLAGNGLDELYRLAAADDLGPSVAWLLRIVYYLLPNFALLDRTTYVVNDLAAPWLDWLIPAAYAIAYSAALLVLAGLRYRRRALAPGGGG